VGVGLLQLREAFVSSGRSLPVHEYPAAVPQLTEESTLHVPPVPVVTVQPAAARPKRPRAMEKRGAR
jgi:hypothetical protein